MSGVSIIFFPNKFSQNFHFFLRNFSFTSNKESVFSNNFLSFFFCGNFFYLFCCSITRLGFVKRILFFVLFATLFIHDFSLSLVLCMFFVFFLVLLVVLTICFSLYVCMYVFRVCINVWVCICKGIFSVSFFCI